MVAGGLHATILKMSGPAGDPSFHHSGPFLELIVLGCVGCWLLVTAATSVIYTIMAPYSEYVAVVSHASNILQKDA